MGGPTNKTDIGERISVLVMLYLKDCIANGSGRWDVYRKLRDAEIFVCRFERKGWPWGI
jgi:hypothetical protein